MNKIRIGKKLGETKKYNMKDTIDTKSADDMDLDIISENIQFYLKFRNMTQKQLAMALQVQPSRLNLWVTGKAIPSVTTLENIAEILEIPLTELFTPALGSIGEHVEAIRKRMHCSTEYIETCYKLTSLQNDDLVIINGVIAYLQKLNK